MFTLIKKILSKHDHDKSLSLKGSFQNIIKLKDD